MTSKVFIPTYLYIKQHSITGKLYFGKVTKKNPEVYHGSGKRWLKHINKHGKEHVITLWYCLFLEQASCTEFALNFSHQQNIVESSDWLNLIPENGLSGVPLNGTYHKHTNEAKRKIAEFQRGRKKPKSAAHRDKLSTANKGIVTAFDLTLKCFVKVSRYEFNIHKNTRYVGTTSRLVSKN